MNRHWIRTLAATLAVTTTLSVLAGIDALARHEASSTMAANPMPSAARLAWLPTTRVHSF